METWSWRWGEDSDAAQVTELVRAAYKELADRGLNYTAASQDESVTRSRMNEGKTLLLLRNDEIVGTITARDDNAVSQRKCAYLGQFGIKPEFKRLGLGTKMMNMIEFWAQEHGYECLQLDTAKPAAHLVDWYLSRGYEIVGETKFEGKTYESWIFEKPLSVRVSV